VARREGGVVVDAPTAAPRPILSPRRASRLSRGGGEAPAPAPAPAQLAAALFSGVAGVAASLRAGAASLQAQLGAAAARSDLRRT
jgi:hypothetical protein